MIGVLGITSSDLYTPEANFVFGYGQPGIGVISYARFVDKETPFSMQTKRTVMQAFSTAGYIVGIPRCTTPTCARAYPNSLAEHDRKEDRLCRVCIENLKKRYREILKR